MFVNNLVRLQHPLGGEDVSAVDLLMLGNDFDAIDMLDLDDLVTKQASEGRSQEFKRDLPGTSDAEVKEFLADVSSLANANGGDLLFGVEEEAGVAVRILGVKVDNIDATILRLENMLRDCLEPRLSGARLRWIRLALNKGVLAVRLPASLNAPHRISFKNSGRFYTRNSRGKYEMDTHELRLAFSASDQLPGRLRALHNAARASSVGENLPFRIRSFPHVVISVVPLSYFRETRSLAISPASALIPVRSGGMSQFILTLEGVLAYSPISERGDVETYALTHDSGRVDAAWVIGSVRRFSPTDTCNLVWPTQFEDGVLEIASSTAAKMKQLGIEPPWVIFTSVMGLSQYRAVIANNQLTAPAWRAEANFIETVTNTINTTSLMPLFKSFWRLFGHERPADL